MTTTLTQGLSTSPIQRPTTGKAVVRWIEELLVHGEGDYFSKPFRLETWQKSIVYRLYEYDPATRRRLVRRLLLVMPKGNGKTELCAALALAEFAGPTGLDKNCKPVPRKSPNIPLAAASWDQADRIYSAARAMVEEGPLNQFINCFDTEMLFADGSPGSLYRVAAVGGTNDGTLPTAAFFDEIHELKGNKERVHLVITNSLAKRTENPGLEVCLTTPDDADPLSLLGRLVEYGQRIERGEIVDPTFLFIHYGARGEYDLDDPQQLRDAIRQATPASWLDIETIAARYEVDRIAEHEFRRYHLAQFVRGGGHWLPEGVWSGLQATDDPIQDGDEIVAGLDGSYSGDSTALWGCRVRDGRLFKLGIWERPPQYPGWVVPRDEVDTTIHKMFEQYKVLELACDPPGWHEEITRWMQEFGEEVVTYFYTNQPRRMAEACDRFYQEAMRGENISHDGAPELERHLYNVVLKDTNSGVIITKERRDSPRKIDAAVAAVVAFATAQFHLHPVEEEETAANFILL